MSDEPAPAYMRMSQHTMDNPHPAGSPEWREWEHKNLWRSTDRLEATKIATARLDAARRALDTPEARAAARVTALEREAGCEPVRDAWCAQWVASLHCHAWFPWACGYGIDDDEDD